MYLFTYLYKKRLVWAESVGVLITIISSLDYAAQAVLPRVFVFVGGFKAHGGKKKI